MKAIKLLVLTLVIVLVACLFVSCNQQEKAYEEAREVLRTYFANTSCDHGLSENVEDGIVLVVKKSGKWYSFTYLDGQLKNSESKITDYEPEAPEGLVLDENEQNLQNVPENVSIYIHAPKK